MANFGQVVPVTGPLVAFPGKVSRMGERVIAARQVLPSTPNPILFGSPVVLVPDATGGTWQSAADFATGGGTITAAVLAGIAVAEVEGSSAIAYPYVPGAAQVASYQPGGIAEVLERGTVGVQLNVAGTPTAGAPVYIRKTLNGSIPAGVVGGLEGAADGSNTVVVPNWVFRTGVVDANGCAEITILSRAAA